MAPAMPKPHLLAQCGRSPYLLTAIVFSAGLSAYATLSSDHSDKTSIGHQHASHRLRHGNPHPLVRCTLRMLLPSVALESKESSQGPDDTNRPAWSLPTDDLISKLFSKKPEFKIPEKMTLPDLNDINARVSELSPAFKAQIENLRESYVRFWDFLSMEEFRKIVQDTWKEDQDVTIHPEVAVDAFVRQGNTLSDGERKFLNTRKQRQRLTFAKFIGVDPDQVHVQDIPVIGVASSGGGYRAMVGSTGYLKSMEETGMLDNVTYIAAVSGSCWALAQYYSPLSNGSLEQLTKHLTHHVNSHIANISGLISVLNTSAHNRKVLMQGIIGRYYQQNGIINLVDVFGMLLGGNLLTERIPVKKSNTDDKKPDQNSDDIKMPNPEDQSVQSGTFQDEHGQSFIARLLDRDTMKLSKQVTYFEDGSRPMPIYCVVRHDENAEHANDDYQWFEFTPYEMGSEEINAWLPVWAFGRKFENGKNTQRIPEQTLGIMMGVFGSAFAASLVHFYREIRGFVPSAALAKADALINAYQDTMSTFHPISPACFPNPFYNLKLSTPADDRVSVPTITHSQHLCLMDAGMDNNIPFYPLLRQGRDVDVIIALDLSADIQTAPHFERAEGYAKRRGIVGWPENAGWPKQKPLDGASQETESAQTISSRYPLGTCTVFASNFSESSKADFSKQDSKMLTLIYLPLIVNPNYDQDFDPQTADFCSTWNFVYTGSQVAKLMGLAQANWNDNMDKVRQVLRECWERKRARRLNRTHQDNQEFMARVHHYLEGF